MSGQTEVGKNERADFARKAKEFAITYKAPLVVFGVIALAIIIDFSFRSSDTDYYTKGLQAMQTGKHDAAVKDFSHALRQNPADSASRFGLGWAYHSKGWVDEALKQYESAAKAAADTTYLANFNAGVILQQKRRLDEAVNSYQAAIAVNPSGFGAVYNLAFVYADRGQNDLALQQYNRAIKLDQRNATAHFNAGLMAERLNRKDEAKKSFQTALSIDPNMAPARDRLKALGG